MLYSIHYEDEKGKTINAELIQDRRSSLPNKKLANALLAYGLSAKPDGTQKVVVQSDTPTCPEECDTYISLSCSC